MAHHTSPRRRRPPDTSSRCRAEKVTGTHDLEVANYSLLDGRIGAGMSIKSAPFSVGGYNWIIDFYPDGQSMEDGCCCCCMSAASAYVSICDAAATVNAKYTLSLVDGDGRAVASWLSLAPQVGHGDLRVAAPEELGLEF